MATDTNLDLETGQVTVRNFEYSPEEKARRTQREAALKAREQAKADKLTPVPASENSIPALRDKVNQILEILRGEV